MNSLLLADWSRIHRVFRGTMWLMATALAIAIWCIASMRATGSTAHSAPHQLRPAVSRLALNR